MINFRSRITGQYPVTPSQIRETHRVNVSFGPTITADVADMLGYDTVFVDQQPVCEAEQRVDPAEPVLSDGAWRQGWTVRGMTPGEIKEAAEREAAALTAKREAMVCTPWQIRKALNATSLRDDVEAGVAAADQATKDAWEFAQEFKRLDPLVLALGSVLGKPDEFMDELFGMAMTL